MKIINIEHAVKVYQMGEATVKALDDVTICVEQGDFIAIMGPSGSGKSTLMNVMGLLDQIDSGSYEILGQQVAQFSEDHLSVLRRKIIGFIFQQFHLLPRTTALENTSLPLLYSEGEIDHHKAYRALSEVHLDQRAGHKTNELSGGQQQRVAIARALINSPFILFADEPTGNLDSKTSVEVMEILKDLNEKGITIIMVTHEEDIAAYASRQVKMIDGKIVSDIRIREKIPAKKLSLEKLKIIEEKFSVKALIALFAQGLKALNANKVRTGLSMLGILIGVASVISMLALGRGAKQSIESSLASLGSNLLVLRGGSTRQGGIALESATTRLTLEDTFELKEKISLIKHVSPSVRGRGQVTYKNHNWNTTVYGVGVNYETMRASTPVLGRFFTEEENTTRKRYALIGQTVLRELFENKNPIGEMIKIDKVSFQIIGVLPEKGGGSWRDQDDVIIIPILTAMKRLLGKDYIDDIEMEVIDVQSMASVEKEAVALMNRRHRVPPLYHDSAFSVRNMADIQMAISQSSQTMNWLLASIAAVSLLVGGIGIMNIMLVSVTERTREIGLRKAIGATSKNILSQFLVEAIVISALGGMLGILVGWGISFLISLFTDWNTSLSIISALLAVIFSTTIGIVFGIYPANKAAKLNPIEALRYE